MHNITNYLTQLLYLETSVYFLSSLIYAPLLWRITRARSTLSRSPVLKPYWTYRLPRPTTAITYRIITTNGMASPPPIERILLNTNLRERVSLLKITLVIQDRC